VTVRTAQRHYFRTILTLQYKSMSAFLHKRPSSLNPYTTRVQKQHYISQISTLWQAALPHFTSLPNHSRDKAGAVCKSQSFSQSGGSWRRDCLYSATCCSTVYNCSRKTEPNFIRTGQKESKGSGQFSQFSQEDTGLIPTEVEALFIATASTGVR